MSKLQHIAEQFIREYTADWDTAVIDQYVDDRFHQRLAEYDESVEAYEVYKELGPLKVMHACRPLAQSKAQAVYCGILETEHSDDVELEITFEPNSLDNQKWGVTRIDIFTPYFMDMENKQAEARV